MDQNVQINKCAPHINYEDGSCISLEILIKIAKAYNKANLNDTIYISNITDKHELKKNLLKILREKIDENEEDWINNDFIKTLDKNTLDQLKNHTFRPHGPQGQFEWLSTIDINKVLHQYENKYDDFKFLGAVPIDFMTLDYLIFNKINFKDFEKINKTRFGIIFNLDESWKGGSHWVSLFIDLNKGQIYFSDSFAINPDKRIEEFINVVEKYLKNNKKMINIDKKYNKTRHQKGNSECGVYSINFILRLLKGKTFDHITRKRLDDKKVNKCRLVYFK